MIFGTNVPEKVGSERVFYNFIYPPHLTSASA